MNRINQIITAKRHGIVIPYAAMRASEDAGLPYYVTCAFLEQESAGGQNVFGHDPTIFVGAGEVTKKKYLDYKKQRKLGRGMQGVGPMQLTWWEFQDQADELGGCWVPYNNVLVAAKLLHGYWNSYGDWVKVGEKYNGAHSYGLDVAAKIKRWKELLT